MDVVGRVATCDAGRALRDDLGWEVVRILEEDAGVARRPSLPPLGGGTTVCGRMEAVEAAAGTRAFVGAFGTWKGFSSRVEGGKGLVSGVVAFHLYALILPTWTWLKAFPGESFPTTGASDRYAVRPRSGARAEGPHLPIPRLCS